MAWSVEGCRAKLARFDENLVALDQENGRYVESKPYSIVPEFDPETGWHSINLSVERSPGLIFGVLIGEAAHNLRCALDHLAWQLANLDGQPPKPRRVQFPILSKEPKGGLVNHVHVNGMRPEHIAALEGLQPYKAGHGRTLLEALAAINDTDKHRLVHTAVSLLHDVAPNAVVAYPGYRIQASEFETNAIVLEGGTDGTRIGRVCIVPENPDPQMYMQSEFGIGVAFGERSSPHYGVAADGLLRLIKNAVEGVITVFDRPGLSGQPPWP